jgi:hypothetical protein
MSRANTLVKCLHEFVPMSNFGEMDGTEIERQFVGKLTQFGYDDVAVDVVMDFEEGVGGGILVTLTDSDDDSVTCLFYVDEDMGPMASVISEDDTQIDVYLSSLNPPLIELGAGTWINMTDLSWMNKSVMLAILMAGDVHESLMYEADGTMSQMGAPTDTPIAKVAAKTAVLMGKKKMRLPVIVQRATQSDPYKRALNKAKILGKNLAPQSFADKIKGQYLKTVPDKN